MRPSGWNVASKVVPAALVAGEAPGLNHFGAGDFIG